MGEGGAMAGRTVVRPLRKATTMGITVRCENVRAALKAAKEIAQGPALLRKLSDEARRMMLALQGEAQRRAPVEEGTLRGAATSGVSFEGTSIKGEVTFGGLASAYAEVQHERDEFKHPRGGQAHYLYGPGSAWAASEKRMVRRLDQRVGEIARQVIGNGG